MNDHTTIRAWKDADYRETLSATDRAVAPSPVGTIDLDEDDLGEVAGGAVITETTICCTTLGCAVIVTIAVSKNISCGSCETTLWSGSCAVSSIGCCP